MPTPTLQVVFQAERRETSPLLLTYNPELPPTYWRLTPVPTLGGIQGTVSYDIGKTSKRLRIALSTNTPDGRIDNTAYLPLDLPHTNLQDLMATLLAAGIRALIAHSETSCIIIEDDAIPIDEMMLDVSIKTEKPDEQATFWAYCQGG